MILTMIIPGFQQIASAQSNEKLIYSSKAYQIYGNRVEQGNFTGKALSSTEMSSDYRSPEEKAFSDSILFRFSINERDNEMAPGLYHHVILQPVDGQCITNAEFGKPDSSFSRMSQNQKPVQNIRWTIRLDMRKVFSDFHDQGYYTLWNGNRLYEQDFKGVYVAGNSPPLIWDFNNLGSHKGLELKDKNGDHIFETTLNMNSKNRIRETPSHWKLSKDISSFPSYHSDFVLSDAVYNLSLEEMLKDIEPDSTFRAGKEWPGVWTRDISYSTLLSMAWLQPDVARNSLLRKVKNGRIVQDTGTGGSWPISTDRMIWASAAWELYKVTGDRDWLGQAYTIIKNSAEDDLHTIFDNETGMVHGESTFMDWRDQSYPRWMQPADIYESEDLGTNAVHYEAYYLLSEMAKILGDDDARKKYSLISAQIKKGINHYLWMKDKGYYGEYLYGRIYKMLSPRSESLGEALSVLFDIADKQQSGSILEKVPVTDFGITCFFPQIPNIPPYHNNAVWPFVQSFWALASAKAGNEKSLLESIAAIYRSSALFLTDKENFEADNGDFAGTEINSSNQLWSIAGNLSIVYRILFGIEFGEDSLNFHPFVPKALSGNRSLVNFRYRNAVLDIEEEGYGNQVKVFEIDGIPSGANAIPYTLSGRHRVRIILADNNNLNNNINKVANYTSPETPLVKLSGERLKWPKAKRTMDYDIYRNAELLLKTHKDSLAVSNQEYSDFQATAVDRNFIPSFASEPIIVTDPASIQIFEMENYAPRSHKDSKGYHGEGFIEISKELNLKVDIPVEIKSEGIYSVSFRYANGNGPINTDNKCAIRTLKINNHIAGTIVLPQRGKDEWSNWGFTNAVQMKLSKGKQLIELSFEPWNENMNGKINSALVDEMYIYRLR